MQNASTARFSGANAVEAPLAMDAPRPMVAQRFRAPSHQGSEGRVTGVDYIGAFDSTNLGYTITPFILNARNLTTFPRLSEIAGVWRRYYFKKLRFHLFGLAAATQSGYVAMSSLVTDDLATQTTPTTDVQILNQENVAVGRPWSFIDHDVNLGGLGLKWYTTDVSNSTSEFGEAIGRAFLGIPQTTASADIRVQVYVEYDVEFCQRIAGSLVTTSAGIVGGLTAGGGAFSTTNVMGDNPTQDPQTNGYTVSASGVFTFDFEGRALLYIDTVGATAPVVNVPAGWTLRNRAISPTSDSVLFTKDVAIGELLGPITASVTPTGVDVIVSRVPKGSVSCKRSMPVISGRPYAW